MGTLLDEFEKVLPSDDAALPGQQETRDDYGERIRINAGERAQREDLSWISLEDSTKAKGLPLYFPYANPAPSEAELVKATERLQSGLSKAVDCFDQIKQSQQKLGTTILTRQTLFEVLAPFIEPLGRALSDILNLKPGQLPSDADRLFLLWLARNADTPYVASSIFELLPLLLLYTTYQPGLFFYAQWRADAQPRIQLDAKLAAALIFTNYESGLIDSLKPPWPTFVIDIPDQLLGSTTQLLVQHEGEKDFGWCICIRGPITFVQLTGASLGEIAQLKFQGRKLRLPARQRRKYSTALRLLIGILSMLNNSSETHPELVRRSAKKKGRPRWLRSATTPTEPYILGKNVVVNIDCREQVREYIGGRRDTLQALRWPVRGHYCHQPYGPRRELRKEIWRQPHFKNRGGADGPMLVRTHVLQGKKKATG